MFDFSHVNVLILTCPDITDMWYVDNSFVITDGQPSTLPPRIGKGVDDPSWAISIDCGRKGSSEVTQGYNTLIGSDLNLYVDPDYCAETSTNWPGNLNFYFSLMVFFGQGGGVMLHVAQGSYDESNYWWIGGDSVLNSCPNGSQAAFLLDGERVYVVTPKDGEVYSFDFSYLAPA